MNDAIGAHSVVDAHLHIIDPRFPLIENNGYLPPAFTVRQYRERVAGLGIAGGAVVSGSFQGFDQGYLRRALAELGPAFVGVTQVPDTVTDEEITELDAAGSARSGSTSAGAGRRPWSISITWPAECTTWPGGIPSSTSTPAICPT